ncbi:MAG: DUF436 family protein, partial [Clostridia bacterium]|nr:DUF436 family protein [Clostridia bacterium]
MDWNDLSRQMREATHILLEAAAPKSGDILVVGCSTSETLGRRIGSASSEEAAAALARQLAPRLEGV